MKIGLVAALNVNPAAPTMGRIYVPLGLLCLGAVLEPVGFKVEVVDPNFWIKNSEIPFQKGFENEIANRIATRNFDVVGFATLANSYPYTLRMAAALRGIKQKIPIMFGGAQATHSDIKTLEAFDSIDAIVRGEGEFVVLDLLNAFAGNMSMEDVKGITYRQNKKIIRNEDATLIEDINDLPFPAYHLYPINGASGVPLDTGRGCPYQCNFCSTCLFWKRRFRQKDPARIADEMHVLKKGFGVKSVEFTHDLFTLNRKKTVEFCKILKRRKINLPWICSTRIDAVDDEILKMMAGSGCTDIYYGVESGSERMQKIIGKGIDVSIVKGQVESTVKNKISATVSFIIGFPEETEADLKKTIDLAFDLLGISLFVSTIQIHLLAVTNETKLWQEYKDQLRYDKIQSDQVADVLSCEDEPLVKQYPLIFPGHYYVPTKHVSRDFLIDLCMMGFTADSGFRWSLVAASNKTGGAFNLAKEWHKWRKKLPGQPLERMRSLIKYLYDNPHNFGWQNEAFKTILNYESNIMVLKSDFIQNEAKRKTKIGSVLKTKKYPFDPNAIIRQLIRRKDLHPNGEEVEIDYIYNGWSAKGPLIKFKRRRHDSFRKRGNKGRHRGRRISPVSCGKLH